MSFFEDYLKLYEQERENERIGMELEQETRRALQDLRRITEGRYCPPEPTEKDYRLKRLGENHQREKEELQQAFEAERRQMQLKVESSINEGKRNIERLEREKKEIEQKRDEKQKKYEKEKNELMELHRRTIERHRTNEENLRQQLIEQNKSQLEMEHRHHAELLDKQSVELEKERERIATVAIMKEYLNIMDTSHKAKVLLEKVNIYCLEDSPESFKAIIMLELDNIRTLREKFWDQFSSFPQFLLDEPKANRKTVDACKGFITQVKETMEHEKMLGICDVLPAALENGDLSRIRSLGAEAEILAANLSNIKNESKQQIENKDLKELTASSSEEVLIDFLSNLFQYETVILLTIISWILCFFLSISHFYHT